jgi:hypothetical protein
LGLIFKRGRRAIGFDFWYEPAVLKLSPEAREKRVAASGLELRRVSLPIWERERKSVRVCYDLAVTECVSGRTSHVREEHVMRYFSLPEMEQALAACGFAVSECGEWITGAPPGDDTFSVYIVALGV